MTVKYSHRGAGLCLVLALVMGQSVLASGGIDRRMLFSNNVKGCVGVMTAGGPASGWVVDVEKRWILTCQHVVGTKSEVDVVFPSYQNGKLIQDRTYYAKTAARSTAKVISTDAKRDLCLIQVDALPAGTVALRIATDSGQPGDNLNLIGNPAASGAMWNYTLGTLRAVYKKKFIYKNTSHEVEALVGETQLPANPGDSGGAVFNDKGEVLGVHSGGTPDGLQLMATYIDVAEVQAFLKEPFRIVAAVGNFEEFFNVGNDHLNRGELDKAIEAYTQAIKVKSDHSEAWRSRGTAFLRKKMYDKAMEDCNQALAVNRSNAKAFNERAVCHGAKGDFKSALADYNEAIRLGPSDAVPWSGRAWAHNNLKEHAKAVPDASEAIRLKSDFAFAYAERGLAHWWLKEFDKALVDLNQATALEPGNIEALYHRGVTLASLNKNAEAIKDFNEVIRVSPKYIPALKERGTLHYHNKDYQLAINDYTEAINLQVKDAQVWLWRSYCHQGLGNREQAEADLRKAQELDPSVGRGRGG